MGNLLSPSIYDMLLSLNKLPFFYGAEHAGTPLWPRRIAA